MIRTEAELASERQQRIESGEVVPAEAAPVEEPRPRVTARPPRPVMLKPGPGTIEPDILIVNDSVVTTAEVLYSLRDAIADLRDSQTAQGFEQQLMRLVATHTQQTIGTILVHTEAMGGLAERARDMLADSIEREMEARINQEFGGSTARFGTHLARFGLTLEQYKQMIERGMVVQQYTRQTLMPRVQIRRAELLDEYQRNISRYSSPELRELLLIEAPFEKFLPENTTWDSASPSARAQAKLKAQRHIRAAEAALSERSFADVAREFSRGLHASDGGGWGQIGRPLQAPYDTASQLIFEYEQGQRSEPFETERGWFIVECGQVELARQLSFVDVQDELRRELSERRFNELASEYVLRLAADATISAREAFITHAVRQAVEPDWPDNAAALPASDATP
ncbi:MAG: peptidylprolyl isomerase [Planctomycetes bacterium]|nr:peptidylprolyl isomerase [Planctomycetota bacterium]